MKRVKTILSSLTLVIGCMIIIGLSSCRDNTASSNDFMVKVDSFKVPETVISSVPFDVVFYGTIGLNGCYSFKTFNRIIKGNDITIEVWGTWDYKSGTCPDELISLNGYKLNLTIPIPGMYRIIVKEPADYTLVRQIIVN